METTNNPTNLQPYIDALKKVYSPAWEARKVSHWFTTKEVYDAIKSIDPGANITLDQVHDAMLEAGFKYQPRPGAVALDLKWMLHQK